jgi:hypothetical protein
MHVRTLLVFMAALGGCSSAATTDPATSHGASPERATGEDHASQPASTDEPSSNEPGTANDQAAPVSTDFASMCPVLADTTPRGGTGPSIAPPGVTEVDWSALRDVVASPPGWTIGSVTPIPRGMAGHASPELNVELTHGGDRVIANLADLVHVCRLASGDGARLRDREVAQSPSTRTTHDFHGWPGCVESRVGGGATVSAWVSDRCRVTVNGGDAAELVTIADALAWDRVAQACAAR